MDIPDLNEFAIKPPKEETETGRIVATTHKDVLDTIHREAAACMYNTTNGRYGQRYRYDTLTRPISPFTTTKLTGKL